MTQSATKAKATKPSTKNAKTTKNVPAIPQDSASMTLARLNEVRNELNAEYKLLCEVNSTVAERENAKASLKEATKNALKFWYAQPEAWRKARAIGNHKRDRLNGTRKVYRAKVYAHLA